MNGGNGYNMIRFSVLYLIILFAIVIKKEFKESNTHTQNTGIIVIDDTWCDLFVDTLDNVTGWYGKQYYNNNKNWFSVGKIISSTCDVDTGLKIMLVGRRLKIGDTLEVEYNEYHATIEK